MEKRINQYFAHYPFVELLSTREGDKELEDLIHICLYSLGCRFQIDKMGKLRLDEWFEGDINIINYVFHSTRKYLERTIWINRNKAFDINDIKNIKSNSLRLLRELHKKYNRCSNLIGQKLIVNKDKKIIDTRATDFDIELFKRLINNFRKETLLPKNTKRITISKEEDKILKDFLDNKFYSTGIFREKMKLFCEFMDKYGDNKYILDSIIHKVDPKFKTFYDLFGTSGCRSVSYEEANLREKSRDKLVSPDLKTRLVSTFRISSRYTLKDIKLTLELIYNKLHISKTPKASDLKEYFEVSEVLVMNKDTGKRSKGYEILGIK